MAISAGDAPAAKVMGIRSFRRVKKSKHLSSPLTPPSASKGGLSPQSVLTQPSWKCAQLIPGAHLFATAFPCSPDVHAFSFTIHIPQILSQQKAAITLALLRNSLRKEETECPSSTSLQTECTACAFAWPLLRCFSSPSALLWPTPLRHRKTVTAIRSRRSNTSS